LWRMKGRTSSLGITIFMEKNSDIQDALRFMEWVWITIARGLKEK
jgi:hypothetical protein